MVENDVLERIQKLLQLANSDNEHEAKLAMDRANNLLLRYNLTMQQVNAVSEYAVQDATMQVGSILKSHHNYILDVLREYFFVKTIVNSSYQKDPTKKHYGKVLRQIRFVGKKVNCEIANHAFIYLDGTYLNLWDKYRAKTGAGRSERNSYFLGLTLGLGEVLKQTKWNIEQEMGLVLVADPALEAKADEITKGKCYSQAPKQYDDKVVAQGIADGTKIRIRKTLGEASQDSGTAIGYKE